MSVIYRPEGTSRGTVFFGVGHGGKDAGAVKYLREETLNLQQALHGKDYMVANGFTVVMSRNRDENDPLTEEIREANAVRGLLCAVDWHNNAGGGDGFEAYYGIGSDTNGSKGLALAIEREVKAIGQNSRGCKTKKNSRGQDYFGFIRQIKARSVIIEGCFVDNRADAAQFDSDAEVKAYGYAVAKGVINWLESTGKVSKKKPVSTSKPATNTVGAYLVKVTAKALNIRSGAGAEYKKTGVIKDKGIYTIVETKKAKDGGTWGKLKSGKGWINLHFTQKK